MSTLTIFPKETGKFNPENQVTFLSLSQLSFEEQGVSRNLKDINII